MTSVLLSQVVLKSGLCKTLHCDIGPIFKEQIFQCLTKALGIHYYLHCTCRRQSLPKIGKAYDLLET